MITPAQCRAARALLAWSAISWPRGRVSRDEHPRFESGDPALPPDGRAAIRRALEKGGAVFFEQDGTLDGGPGVGCARQGTTKACGRTS